MNAEETLLIGGPQLLVGLKTLSPITENMHSFHSIGFRDGCMGLGLVGIGRLVAELRRFPSWSIY